MSYLILGNRRQNVLCPNILYIWLYITFCIEQWWANCFMSQHALLMIICHIIHRAIAEKLPHVPVYFTYNYTPCYTISNSGKTALCSSTLYMFIYNYLICVKWIFNVLSFSLTSLAFLPACGKSLALILFSNVFGTLVYEVYLER